MAKLEISNWLEGISFSDRLGKEGSYYIGTAVNPYNPLAIGYLSPGPEPVALAVVNSVSQINSFALTSSFFLSSSL